MKKETIPEDQRAMFPVDPRILVRRTSSREPTTHSAERGCHPRNHARSETRIGSSSTARAR
jgi:hypothetical protein